MTVEKAKLIIESRNGRPEEDDWELAEAAAVLLAAVRSVESLCEGEIAASLGVITDRDFHDCSEVEKRARVVKATASAVVKILRQSA